MDFGALASLGTSINDALAILRSVSELRADAKLRAATTELELKLSTAAWELSKITLQNAELAAAHRDLKEQLMRAEDRLKDSEHYALTALASGALVYAYQPSGETQKPPHYACTRCWDVDQKKSLLQPFGAALRCPECKTQLARKPSQPSPRLRTVAHSPYIDR